MKAQYLASAGLLAVVMSPCVASAQDAGSTAPAEATQDGDQLQDIVVTAQKVESSIQRTPIAISAFEGDTLVRAGVTNASQLNKLVPGVQADGSGPGASSIFIRGVGTRVLNAFADPGNAFAIDGVYLSRPTGASQSFFDLQRLEVVKGPQGTLYGRNATGGAVNVITNRPDPSRRSAEITMEAGNYDLMRATAAVNLPLGDTLAIRAAGQVIHRDGYLTDGYDDEKVQAGRLSLLWEASNAVSLFVSADYAHTGGRGFATIPTGPGNGLAGRFVVPGDPYTGPSDPRIVAYTNTAPLSVTPFSRPVTVPGQTGLFCVSSIFPGAPTPTVVGRGAIPLCGNPLGVAGTDQSGFVDNHNAGVNATATVDLGFGEWTTIGGWRYTKNDNRYFIGPEAQTVQNRVNQYSGETRIASKADSPFTWIVGAFYLIEKQRFNGLFESGNLAIPNPSPAPGSALPQSRCAAPFDPDGAGPAPASTTLCIGSVPVLQFANGQVLPDVTNETWAGFGQVTAPLTDWFRVTGGIRYTEESKESANGLSTQVYSRPVGLTTSFPSSGRVSFKDTSYRAGVELDVAERSMAYASYATAYHAGGINFGVEPGPAQPYRYLPEKVKAWTLGIKNRFFDNTLQLNVEGFWYDYTNLQVNGVSRVNDGSTACSTLNIINACPLTLRTDNAGKARIRGVETDLTWRAWRGSTIFANILYNDATYRSFVLRNSQGVASDYSGLTLSGVSKWTVSGGITQAVPLGNGGRLIGEVRSQYRNDTWMWYIRHPGNFQPAYTRTDLNLTYELPRGAIAITGYVRNIEDKATLLQGYTPNVETGVPWVNLNPPRTFGAILTARF